MPQATQAALIVRRCRLRANLSQGELGRLAGTTQSAISRLESGATTPSFDRVARLVELMGMSLETVLVDRDWDDSALARNCALSAQERWDNAVRAARFVQVGRAAMQAAHVRPD